ncbi:TadE/TadG family type IV pilus assembly protein [Pseudorhodobacter sp. W20_MBD10_FR17]|uniref:TadE/TadG family type IV pilus assembly protein n=1 Tax=Pseudorhodobacter sp. W20_MBD10_FR17 TaxID=3240266 RepID=UPI003F9A4B28
MTQLNITKNRSWMARLTAPMRRVFASEEGTATIDFVLCIPVIMTIFIASIESGVLMTRFLLLERSVDIVMRNLRLGEYPNPTSDFLKAEICDRSTILEDCEANITIALEPIDQTTWAFPSREAGCVDRSNNISPALTYNPGAAHEIMMVRVCVIQDAVFPSTGIGLNLPKDAKGGYGLITTSAFVNEP